MIIQLYGGPDDGAELEICALIGEAVYVHHCPPPEVYLKEGYVSDPEAKVPVACYQVIPGNKAVYRGML